MVIAPLLGRVSDRRGRLLPLRFALAAAIVVTIGLAVPGPLVIAPLVVAAAIAFGSFWAPAMALLSDAAERIGLAQGLAFGLMNAAWEGELPRARARRRARRPGRGRASLRSHGGLLRLTLLALTRGGTRLASSGRVPENP